MGLEYVWFIVKERQFHLTDEGSEGEQSALVCSIVERSPVRPGVWSQRGQTHFELNWSQL